MLRRVAVATFAAAALLVVACGHQVTPSPNNNDLSGRIVLKFRVNGTLDFTNFTYAVIFDTCGNGPPYPDAYRTSFNSYSYGFFIGGSFGTALPQLVEYFVNPNSNGQIQSINVPENPSLEQLVLNSNGQNSEFELIFDRAELNNPLQQPQPCPGITASPGPTAGASATPSASASPSAAPSASPSTSPSASASPNTIATTAAQQYWYVNFFTIQGSTIQDSLGIGGPHDTTFNGVGFDTNTTNDYPIFKAVGGVVPANPAAQLAGGDIQNYL